MTRRHVVNAVVAAAIVVAVVGILVADALNDGDDAVATTTTATTIATTTTSSTTTSTTTTTSSTTTSTTTTLPPTTTEAPPPHEWVPIVVTNGGSVGERVALTGLHLASMGYTDVRGVNAPVPIPATTVFYLPDWRSSADRLAAELELPADAVRPIEEAPPIAGMDNAVLLVYLGGT